MSLSPNKMRRLRAHLEAQQRRKQRQKRDNQRRAEKNRPFSKEIEFNDRREVSPFLDELARMSKYVAANRMRKQPADTW